MPFLFLCKIIGFFLFTPTLLAGSSFPMLEAEGEVFIKPPLGFVWIAANEVAEIPKESIVMVRENSMIKIGLKGVKKNPLGLDSITVDYPNIFRLNSAFLRDINIRIKKGEKNKVKEDKKEDGKKPPFSIKSAFEWLILSGDKNKESSGIELDTDNQDLEIDDNLKPNKEEQSNPKIEITRPFDSQIIYVDKLPVKIKVAWEKTPISKEKNDFHIFFWSSKRKKPEKPQYLAKGYSHHITIKKTSRYHITVYSKDYKWQSETRTFDVRRRKHLPKKEPLNHITQARPEHNSLIITDNKNKKTITFAWKFKNMPPPNRKEVLVLIRDGIKRRYVVDRHMLTLNLKPGIYLWHIEYFDSNKKEKFLSAERGFILKERKLFFLSKKTFQTFSKIYLSRESLK